ncbi:hypothetical protein LSH36_340g06005 [Paralvinella palmiformis]|uniref:Uncharacterized protein n=1 Tax=Paralvinella palmiformis TaxID=53620 RepID=A0AAD9JG17_9ANNE|nr:hypothetical protein LSH36_340g06005 [Paralvinella palmiformis]
MRSRAYTLLVTASLLISFFVPRVCYFNIFLCSEVNIISDDPEHSRPNPQCSMTVRHRQSVCRPSGDRITYTLIRYNRSNDTASALSPL